MDPSPERLLDTASPQWDCTARHARLVQASPAAVWRALHEASMRDLPVARGLIRHALLRAVARRAEGNGA